MLKTWYMRECEVRICRHGSESLLSVSAGVSRIAFRTQVSVVCAPWMLKVRSDNLGTGCLSPWHHSAILGSVVWSVEAAEVEGSQVLITIGTRWTRCRGLDYQSHFPAVVFRNRKYGYHLYILLKREGGIARSALGKPSSQHMNSPGLSFPLPPPITADGDGALRASSDPRTIQSHGPRGQRQRVLPVPQPPFRDADIGPCRARAALRSNFLDGVPSF